MMQCEEITSVPLFKFFMWAKSPFFLPIIAAAPSVHTPTQLFRDSSFAMKNSFNFTKMSSPVDLPYSG
jgi:hypothetical protein